MYLRLISRNNVKLFLSQILHSVYSFPEGININELKPSKVLVSESHNDAPEEFHRK